MHTLTPDSCQKLKFFVCIVFLSVCLVRLSVCISSRFCSSESISSSRLSITCSMLVRISLIFSSPSSMYYTCTSRLHTLSWIKELSIACSFITPLAPIPHLSQTLALADCPSRTRTPSQHVTHTIATGNIHYHNK